MGRNMANGQTENELINIAATHHGVPADVLMALLELETQFENFSVFGSKVDFSRQVAKILDEASGKAGA